MHLEVLVEDQSGKKALELLIPNIIGNNHTFNIHSYKGIGRLPKTLNTTADPSKRILLDQLPKLLRGYGKTFAGFPANYKAAVVLVCDLDDKCLSAFRKELLDIVELCDPKPRVQFCIAVEEGEAWFLGDLAAITSAYPKAANAILHSYKNDAICGTWELLADAVYPGGSLKLKSMGWHSVGAEKTRWAKHISPQMDIDINNSPSFCYFRDKLKILADEA